MQHPIFNFDGEGSQIVDSLAQKAKLAEELGFDSFWVIDHLHQIRNFGAPNQPMLEGWTTISVLAGLTSRIKLGTLVTGNIYRFPSLLAKIGATLDVLSKGRLWFGVGASNDGANKEEAEAYGIPYPPTAERLAQLEEAVQIILRMWTDERATFEGKYYQIRDAFCNPKPIQKPHPPLLVAGDGERKTLRIVAKYADACNIHGSVATVARKLSILKEHCSEVGRDYKTILKTKLSRVMIDDNASALTARINREYGSPQEEHRRENLICGSPEEVHKQVTAFKDAGLDYMIANFQPGYESHDMTLLAKLIQ